MAQDNQENKDSGVQISDRRMARPMVISSKKEQQTLVIQPTTSFEMKGKEVFFYSPNPVSLCLNISSREFSLSHKIFTKDIEPKLVTDMKFTSQEDLEKLFNYFEHIQTSIIFSYTAIESFANGSIPNDYTLNKINSKGVEEIWKKENIERWFSTSDKLKEVLPSIYNRNSPVNEPGWNEFILLEKIRNEIIHQKTTKRGESLDNTFYRFVLETSVFDAIQSSKRLIEYFVAGDEFHPAAPFGCKNDLIKPIIVEEFADRLEFVSR